MSDLWKEDPEAFIILRLQESSDPNAAHKAFQAHLKEDAEIRKGYRTREVEANTRRNQVEAENARLREDLFAARNALLTEGRQRDTLLAALRRIAEENRGWYGMDSMRLEARAAIAEVEGEKP